MVRLGMAIPVVCEKCCFPLAEVQKKWKTSGNGERQQEKLSNLMSHVTYTSCTLAPRLTDVCEKNVFCSFVFVPQPAENNTRLQLAFFEI